MRAKLKVVGHPSGVRWNLSYPIASMAVAVSCYFCFQSSASGARMAIIGAEDEDFENDIEPVSVSGEPAGMGGVGGGGGGIKTP